MKTACLVLLTALLLVPLVPGRAAGPEEARPAPATTAQPDFPTSEATVSLLEPAGGQCEWVKWDPLSSKRRVLTRLAVDCQGGSTALSSPQQRRRERGVRQRAGRSG